MTSEEAMMDIADILDPRKELNLAEFTGSTIAGPSGQQPQIAPFYGRMFDQEVIRRRQPETYEVHGMETARRKGDDDAIAAREGDAVFDSLFKAKNGKWFIGFGKRFVGPFKDGHDASNFLDLAEKSSKLSVDDSGKRPPPDASQVVSPQNYLADAHDR